MKQSTDEIITNLTEPDVKNCDLIIHVNDNNSTIKDYVEYKNKNLLNEIKKMYDNLYISNFNKFSFYCNINIGGYNTFNVVHKFNITNIMDIGFYTDCYVIHSKVSISGINYYKKAFIYFKYDHNNNKLIPTIDVLSIENK